MIETVIGLGVAIGAVAYGVYWKAKADDRLTMASAISNGYTELQEEIRRERPTTEALTSELRTLRGEVSTLKKNVTDLPRKTLRTFEGSTNVVKGEISEWAAYQKLHTTYDRVIPVNSIFDFLCIKLPEDDNLGAVHFVEIKTGTSKLSKDQRAMRSALESGDKSFKTIKVQVS